MNTAAVVEGVTAPRFGEEGAVGVAGDKQLVVLLGEMVQALLNAVLHPMGAAGSG